MLALASQAAPHFEFALCYARIDHKLRATSFTTFKHALQANAANAFLRRRRCVKNERTSNAAICVRFEVYLEGYERPHG